MSDPSIAVSQTWVYSSSGDEVHLSADVYFAYCIVQNATDSSVNVACDGGTAVAGEGTSMLTVPPNSIGVFGNLLPLPNSNTAPATDETASTGFTAQAGYQGSALTYCSAIPQSDTATGEITIQLQ